MCGIFGEIGRGNPDLTSAAGPVSNMLVHRGPDAAGLDSGEGWMLGFRRLAILDLNARANQPMRSPDNRHVLVFNGEIYNYLELRQSMEAEGETFTTTGDVEVLLRLLMRRGSKALPDLNGMFAFVFVDLETRRFLMARDRFGVKPLYVHATPGRLRFASELGALTAWPGTELMIDFEALRDYLSLGYIPGGSCIWTGYEKFPPGHCAEGSLDAPEIRPQPWWSIDIQPARGVLNIESLLEELDALLTDATAIRTRSDVPMALLLSGGIDSGLVAARLSRGSSPPLALVAGFDEAGYDETGLARATADHLGLPVRVMRLSGGNLSEVDRVASAYDEPFGDPSALPTLHICEAARESAIVLMSGDGGDEAFAGYRRYIEIRRFRRVMSLPDSLKRQAWRLGRNRLAPAWEFRLAKATLPGDSLGSVFDGLGLGRDPVLAELAGEALRPLQDLAQSTARTWSETSGRDLLSRQRLFDYRQYLPDDVLVKVDRASMKHSTEVRSPFLDYRVAEFAARLPNRFLIDGDRGKAILRRLAKRDLPPGVVTARKQGFGVPVGAWMRSDEGAALVRARLADPERNPHRLWCSRGVEKTLSSHRTGERDCGEHLWRLLILESWLRQEGERHRAS